MKTKLQILWQQLLRSPKRFPVEAALGVVFFLLTVIGCEGIRMNEVGPVLLCFIPLVAISHWLQSVNRMAYQVSFLLFLPLLALDLEDFILTIAFCFTYVLAAILLIIGNRKLDNRSFVANALHVYAQFFMGVLIVGIFSLAVLAIIASFSYIFDITVPEKIYFYILTFIWFVLAPQVCCMLISQEEDNAKEPAKTIRIILNYIITPAIIIYTLILYIYFLKIIVVWELPKGGVAWMVMAFISVALIGRALQSILDQRYYDWFYHNLTLIAIPPIILYWVGSIYRIRMYSFTEARFYLILAGILMTLFVLMLYNERTRKYQLMTLILSCAIIVFTYIPGISAKSIGLACQKQRMDKFISEYNLRDKTTGKLKTKIDVPAICKDSIACENYKEFCDVVKYVREGMDNEDFSEQYGSWGYVNNDFNYHRQSDCNRYIDVKSISRENIVELDEYTILLPGSGLRKDFNDERIIITNCEGDTLIDYPIFDIMRHDTTYLQNPEQLLTYKNDSLMLILDYFKYADTTIAYVGNDYIVFRKKLLK